VECSSVVADRVKGLAITTPETPVPPAGDAAFRRTGPHRGSAVQKTAIKNTTSNRTHTANTARRDADRPQKAGAGVAEWG
jgi:hypothetical protein